MAIKDLKPNGGISDEITKKATESLTPGEFVKISSSGIAKADAGEAYIGQVKWDDRYMAANDATAYASGALVPVVLVNRSSRVIAGAAVTIGNYVKLTTDGRIIPEATATTRTVNTVGVALTAASTNGDVIDIALY